MTLRVGWFATGRGQSSPRLLGAAVAAIRARKLDAGIAFVFCNRERGENETTDAFLDLVASYGIPCLTLSSREFRRARRGERSRPGAPLPAWRVDYDRAVSDLIDPYAFDVGMLAGYMLIFTGEMARRHPFLNLHPAAPGGPAGTWQDVIWRLIDARAERSGVMVHLATESLDEGPVVAYCTYALRGPAFDAHWRAVEGRSAEEIRAAQGEDDALFREIRRHGAERELPLVVATLRAVAGGRVRIESGRVLDSRGRELPDGLDLTPEIDAAVAPALSSPA
jgi:folate-dependent phosphoribosylglycinamide formyltransferase PurN